MRFVPAIALGLMLPLGGAVLLTSAPALAAKKDEAPQLKPSPEFVKVYLEVDKLIKANDFAGAKAKLPEAQAAAKSADDQYFTGNLILNIGIATQDQALQRQGLEKMLATGKASPADTGKFNFFVGQFALQAKEYDAAEKYLTAAVAANYPGSGAHLMLAETYFGKASSAPNVVNNQFTPAGKAVAQQGLSQLKQAIDIEKAAGQPVPPEWYTRGFRMASISGSPDLATWTSGAITGPGQGENWRIALRTFQDNHRSMTRDENLDVLRLMAVTGALTEAYSYSEYADAASKAGLIGETKAVIESGRAAGNLKPTQLAELYQSASAGIARDKASLPSAEADAAKAANGRTASFTANAYLSYADYAKAATLYRLALQKGGVDTNEVNTRLGIALARSGDTAGAKAAFANVTGPGNRKEIADLWLSWLNSKAA